MLDPIPHPAETPPVTQADTPADPTPRQPSPPPSPPLSPSKLSPSRVSPRAPLLVGAVLLLAAAVHAHNGLYSPGAAALLVLALIAFAYAAGLGGRARLEERSHKGPRREAFHALIAFAIALQGSLILTAEPLNDVHFWRRATAWPYYVGWCVATVGGLLLIAAPRPVLGRVMAMMLMGVALAGTWAVQHNLTPRVDVYYYQQDAASHLLQGRNPYTLTFVNPYNPEENWVFAPDVLSDDGKQILRGYPYLPVTLLGVLPGRALGDYRYAHVAAVVLSGLLIWRAFATREAALAAALLLTHPRLPWLFEWGWTEPLLVLLFSATIYTARRLPSWTWLPLGLLLAGKQYMLLVLPLLPLAVPPGVCWKRQSVWAVVLALALTAPLALWNLPAFWDSAVLWQLAQPFRPDALSLSAALFHTLHLRPPDLLPLALATGLAAALLATRLRTRGPATFVWAAALVLTTLFVTSKQAFVNYYFFVSAIWCVALATVTAPASSDPRPAGAFAADQTN